MEVGDLILLGSLGESDNNTEEDWRNVRMPGGLRESRMKQPHHHFRCVRESAMSQVRHVRP